MRWQWLGQPRDQWPDFIPAHTEVRGTALIWEMPNGVGEWCTPLGATIEKLADGTAAMNAEPKSDIADQVRDLLAADFAVATACKARSDHALCKQEPCWCRNAAAHAILHLHGVGFCVVPKSPAPQELGRMMGFGTPPRYLPGNVDGLWERLLKAVAILPDPPRPSC